MSPEEQGQASAPQEQPGEQAGEAYGQMTGSQATEGKEGQNEEAPCDWRAPVGDGALAQADDQPNPEAVEAAKQKETCDPPADWRSPGG